MDGAVARDCGILRLFAGFWKIFFPCDRQIIRGKSAKAKVRRRVASQVGKDEVDLMDRRGWLRTWWLSPGFIRFLSFGAERSMVFRLKWLQLWLLFASLTIFQAGLHAWQRVCLNEQLFVALNARIW